MTASGSDSGPTRPGRHKPSSRRAWAFERGGLWAIDLAGEDFSPAPVQTAVPALLDEVPPASAEQLAQAMDLAGAAPVRRRFATGRRCFAAWVDGQIASYCWVSQTAECIGELEREIQLPPGEAYIWNCATRPELRRKNLYNALLSHLTVQLRSEGLRRVWIGSSLDNRPSFRAFARAGFRPVATALYVRLFNLSCLRVAGYPSAPEALVAAARQRLALSKERAWGSFLISAAPPVRLPACAQM